MSKNIVEELPARKHAPAAAPAKGGKPEAKKGGGKATGSVEESSEKKIRQAVYDIRYRARREDIDLKAAYSQYMSNSSLSQAERTAVREKLFGKEGGGVKEQVMLNVDEIASDNLANALHKVFVEKKEKEIELEYLKQLEEDAESKYQVRVTDKNGKVYTRNATRSKITQLRQNPNIKSVEMSDHGEPYEGKKAKKDYDGDGKVESGSKEHAGAVHNAIQRKKGGNPDGKDTRKEALERAWKQAFLADGTVTTEPKNKTKVTGEGVDNYKSGAIKIAPANKEEDPSVASASARGGIYASFAHQKMLEVIAEKAACASKKKKKEYSEAVVNTKECEKKPEEEKDMRGTYAKINLVKNKLRSMGQKDPCVMLADIDSEDEKKKVDEGLGSTIQDKLQDTFTKVDMLKKKYPGIADALQSIVKPINPKATGKNYPTAADQKAKGLRTGN